MRRSLLYLLSFLSLLVLALFLAAPAVPRAVARQATQESSPAEGSQDDELEVFVPSEEVPADSSVSFPVDI